MYLQALACAQLAVNYMRSGVVDVSTVAAVREQQNKRTKEQKNKRGPLLLRRMRAALYLRCCVAPIGVALASCLLLCCCVALPCPFTPGEQTDQCPSPLLMLEPCSYHCPQSLVGRYPGSSVFSVMLWATSGSTQTHMIEQGRNHLLLRDAR